MYSELDDKTLVMLTLAGDQSEYEILVARYQYRVTTAAMSLLHSKFMADDAAQDALCALGLLPVTQTAQGPDADAQPLLDALKKRAQIPRGAFD